MEKNPANRDSLCCPRHDPEKVRGFSELIWTSLRSGVAHRVFEQSPLEKLQWNIACHLEALEVLEIIVR